MPDEPQDYRRYLDPDTLAKVGSLDMVARLVVEGLIQGLHRSPYFGFSVEFAQHREYAPGDDIKHLDWKVYSKTDRHFIKQYEQETNLRAHILLDVSESMRYGRTTVTKFQYGCYLAATLTHILLGQQDQVGLILFDDDIRRIVPPSGHPNQLLTFAAEMNAADPRRKTTVEPVFHKISEELTRRGMVIILSDLFVPRDGLLRGLRQLRHRRHEVVVFHIMDDDELQFPLDGLWQFRGLEATGELRVQPRAVRQAYLDVVTKYLTEVRRQCIAEGIDYRLVNTQQKLDATLSGFLAQRQAFARSTGTRR